MGADSPEERLLGLIKGKNKKTEIGSARAEEAVRKFLVKNKILKSSSISAINRVLAILLLVLCAFFAYVLIFPARLDTVPGVEEPAAGPERGADAGQGVGTAKPAGDYSYFSSQIAKRRLFSPSSGGDALAAQQSTVNAAKRFELVGIIAGEKPQAVIEDKETSKTHYVYAGESVNGVIVEEISGNSVKLNLRGEIIMLIL